MNFPPIPKGLKDMLELARWLLKLETWAKITDAVLDALYKAEVHQVSSDATIDPAWDSVEYVGPGAHTLTLPSAKRAGTRRTRVLWVINNGSAAITLAAQAGETIGGDATQPFGGQATTVAMSSGGLVGLLSNGDTRWRAFGGLSEWMRIRNNGGSGAGTHVPFEVDDGGEREFYVECGGATPHTHVSRVLTVAGTVTMTGASLALGGASSAIGAYGVTPTVRLVLPTGAGKTVDDVITALQTIGWVKQS